MSINMWLEYFADSNTWGQDIHGMNKIILVEEFTSLYNLHWCWSFSKLMVTWCIEHVIMKHGRPSETECWQVYCRLEGNLDMGDKLDKNCYKQRSKHTDFIWQHAQFSIYTSKQCSHHIPVHVSEQGYVCSLAGAATLSLKCLFLVYHFFGNCPQIKN